MLRTARAVVGPSTLMLLQGFIQAIDPQPRHAVENVEAPGVQFAIVALALGTHEGCTAVSETAAAAVPEAAPGARVNQYRNASTSGSSGYQYDGTLFTSHGPEETAPRPHARW